MGKKVYVGNLPFKYGYKELVELFEKYGEIEEALVVADRFNNRSKGYGFVKFVKDGDANKAIAELDKKEIEGRRLKVVEATMNEEKGLKKKEKEDQIVIEEKDKVKFFKK